MNFKLNQDIITYLIKNNKLLACELFFTKTCNLRCKYCYVHKEKEENFDSNLEVWKDLFNRIYSNLQIERFYIDLWGGEPLINYDYFKNFTQLITELSKKYNIKTLINFSTNGVFYLNNSSKLIKDCFDNEYLIPPKYFQISYDGIATTEETRGLTFQDINNILKEATKNLKIRFKDTHVFPEVRNYDYAKNIISLYELSKKYDSYFGGNFAASSADKDFKTNHIIYQYGDGKLLIDNILSLYDHYYNYEKDYNFCERYIGNINNYYDAYSTNSFYQSICSSGNNNFGFCSNGDIYPCHRLYTFPDHIKSQFLLGNFLKNEIYFNKLIKFNSIKMNKKNIGCQGCNLSQYNFCCTCFYDSYSFTGNYSSFTDLCAFYKEAYNYLTSKKTKEFNYIKKIMNKNKEMRNKK